jgi:hypothetical protein
MINAQEDLLDVFVEGRPLTDEQRVLTLTHGWNSISYMLEEPLSLRDALADYYDKAKVGDVIKSKNQFAVFTENNKWEGSLQTMRPGQGYLLRRTDTQPVTIHYYAASKSNAPKKTVISSQPSAFSNPNAATNMTLIAKIEGIENTGDELRVFVNDELAAVATPIDSLFFMTIQSDNIGELRFEINGETYVPVCGTMSYSADTHHGSVKAPILLKKEDILPYKIIENNHIIIIRNNEKYSISGSKL